jgi:hypothetical protein
VATGGGIWTGHQGGGTAHQDGQVRGEREGRGCLSVDSLSQKNGPGSDSEAVLRGVLKARVRRAGTQLAAQGSGDCTG